MKKNVKRQSIITIIKTTYDNVLATKKTVLEFIHSMEFYYSPANEVHRAIMKSLSVRLFVHIRVLPVTFKFCFDNIIPYSNMCESPCVAYLHNSCMKFIFDLKAKFIGLITWLHMSDP